MILALTAADGAIVSLEKTKVRNALDNRDKKYQKLDQTNAPDPKVKRNGQLAGERQRARARLTL